MASKFFWYSNVSNFFSKERRQMHFNKLFIERNTREREEYKREREKRERGRKERERESGERKLVGYERFLFVPSSGVSLPNCPYLFMVTWRKRAVLDIINSVRHYKQC
jgi:hypothetical protein